MATITKAAGCYKCGRTGHWSRDCTVPPSEWTNQQGTASQAVVGSGKSQTDKLALNTGENDPVNQLLVLKVASQQRKRPKVTLELLEGPEGLKNITEKFPASFRQQFKGKGHEVGDLRRLLEMFKRWQERIFPSSTFDEFITNVEKLSAKNALKHTLRSKRMKIIQDFQDALLSTSPQADDSNAETHIHSPAELPVAQHAVEGLGPADEDDLDDLIELEKAGHPADRDWLLKGAGCSMGQQAQEGGLAAHVWHDEDELYEVEDGLAPNEDEMAILDGLEDEIPKHNSASLGVTAKGVHTSSALQPSTAVAGGTFTIGDEDALYEVEVIDQPQPSHLGTVDVCAKDGARRDAFTAAEALSNSHEVEPHCLQKGHDTTKNAEASQHAEQMAASTLHEEDGSLPPAAAGMEARMLALLPARNGCRGAGATGLCGVANQVCTHEAGVGFQAAVHKAVVVQHFQAAGPAVLDQEDHASQSANMVALSSKAAIKPAVESAILPGTINKPIEDSVADLERLGTEEIVHAAYRQVAALHACEPNGQLLEDDQRTLEMCAASE